MAFSLNRAQVIGNVTRDPEVRQTSGGRTVASFAVATNRSWTDKSGQRQDKAEFHNIVVWGKLAELVGQYVKKGRKIFVEGRMQTSDWQGEDGVKRYRTEIIAENFILLDKAGAPTGEEGGVTTERTTQSASVKPAAASKLKEEEVSIDDLPF